MPFSAKPSAWWKGLDEAARRVNIELWLPMSFEFVRVEPPARVVLRQKEGFGISERGDRLLDLEQTLRFALDSSIEVMLEPKGDLNKLRTRLRGVKT